MAVESEQRVQRVAAGVSVGFAPHRRIGTGWAVPYVLVSPAIVYMTALVGYPFLLAIYFSLSNASVQQTVSGFVGLDNFGRVVGDSLFQRALLNSFIFTFGSGIFKGVLGVTLAFLMLRPFPARKVIRGLLMLPWTLPISLSVLGWQWMFDPQFSVINWIAGHLGLIQQPYPNWLGEPLYAMIAVMTVNIWRGFPFTAIIVLAGLTSIPSEIIDSAKVDGAGFFKRWNMIIVPMIMPILFVGLLFDMVFTFTDLSVVYLLTKGGPPDGPTDILPTLAFRVGILGGDLSRGSAIALFMFPLLFLAVIFMLRYLKRRDV
ncbi:MAG TPA: sugar ABC transporter permease [Chloroflexota bacterium]|nr:sugar ABC transporter permease [Chloroflexota bacterium]